MYMKKYSEVIIYSKSIFTAFTYIFISFILLIVYFLFSKNLSLLTNKLIKYSAITLLSLSIIVIIKNNYIHLNELKMNIFYTKHKSLRNSIVYNSILIMFIAFFIYHIIYF